MNKKNPPKLTYALNANNEWVNIENVPQNGNLCGCFCPYCHSPLQAKRYGKKNQHHFAHISDRECKVSHESALHIMAKEIIEEQKAVMVPVYHPKRYTELHEQTPENANEYLYWEDYYFDFEELKTDKEKDRFDPYWRLRFFPSQQLRFEKVEIEKNGENNSLRPDCIATTAYGIQYAIEIFVTHKINDLKFERIQKGGVNCLEIKIPQDYILNKELLSDFLLQRTEGRKWINYPYADETILQQVEKAQREAIIKQRSISGVKEIPEWRCNSCKECLRQFDAEYEEYLKLFEGKLHDWACDVFKMKPEDIISNHIGIKRTYQKESFVTLNNKANFIYKGNNDKKKCDKTFAFFFGLMDTCNEIISLAKDHSQCRFFIAKLVYRTKRYVFCAKNHDNHRLGVHRHIPPKV